MNGITLEDVERLLCLYEARSEVMSTRSPYGGRQARYEAVVRQLWIPGDMVGRGTGRSEAEALWAAMADAMTSWHDDTQFERAAA